MYVFFFCQFEYDKEPEVNVTFYIKDKVTDRKIDSTLRGTFQFIFIIIAYRSNRNVDRQDMERLCYEHLINLV